MGEAGQDGTHVAVIDENMSTMSLANPFSVNGEGVEAVEVWSERVGTF